MVSIFLRLEKQVEVSKTSDQRARFLAPKSLIYVMWTEPPWWRRWIIFLSLTSVININLAPWIPNPVQNWPKWKTIDPSLFIIFSRLPSLRLESDFWKTWFSSVNTFEDFPGLKNMHNQVHIQPLVKPRKIQQGLNRPSLPPSSSSSISSFPAFWTWEFSFSSYS